MFKREFKIFLLGFFLLPFFNGLIVVEDQCVTIRSYYDKPVEVVALMSHRYVDGPDYKDTGRNILGQGQLNTNEKVMLKCPFVPFEWDSDVFDRIGIAVIFPDGTEVIENTLHFSGESDFEFYIEKDGNIRWGWTYLFMNISGYLKNSLLQPEYVKNEWKPIKDYVLIDIYH